MLNKDKDCGRLMESIENFYSPAAASAQRERYRRLLDAHAAAFGEHNRVAVFSASGRTEIGGNHTDHQRGKVLAGSVDLDVIAAVSLNGKNVIRVQSEGFSQDVVELDRWEARLEERGHSCSMIRGIAAWFAQRGCPVQGFDAYTTSNVRKGSGLSSSAAFEILIGSIINELFYGGQCGPVQLAQAGQYAENIYFGKPSGLLDQMACAMGGLVAMDFQDSANPVVERIPFDFPSAGHALCIIDSGADHADLTDEYAAVTRELKEVCAYFGKEVLREVPEEEFWAALPALRRKAGDRAVLRAIHIYEENRRVERETTALREGDFPAFLREIQASGLSSWRLLQNVVPTGYTRRQEVAFALALCEKLLQGKGACRVHGGGFAGTIQAFVPLEALPSFRSDMDAVLGNGACHVLTIRHIGGIRLA